MNGVPIQRPFPRGADVAQGGGSAAVEVRKVSKNFETNGETGVLSHRGVSRIKALRDISFTIGKGEIVAICGPNSSGKSTLIRAVGNAFLPDVGDIFLFEMDVRRNPQKVRPFISRVSSDAGFSRKVSARENFAYSAKLCGLSPDEAERRIEGILRGLDLRGPVLYQPLEQMSLGMQQRIAIARALLTSPVLLLLDDPTIGLDPLGKRDVHELIMQIRRHHDATILFASNDMQEVEKLCDRVLIMKEGQLIAEGTPAALKAQTGRPSFEEAFIALLSDEEAPLKAAP